MKPLQAGAYQFSLPYLSTPSYTKMLAANHPVSTVDIELHIGRHDDLQIGKEATIIAFSSYADPNHIAPMFSMVRNLWLTKHRWEIPTDKIRLIEVHTKSHDPNDWHELEMSWDNTTHRYHDPIWKSIQRTAWYYQQYQEKINSYAWDAYQTFSDMGKHRPIVLSQLWEQWLHKSNTPFWLLKVLRSADIYLRTEKIPLQATEVVLTSLKHLTGVSLEDTDQNYLPEVTTLLITEIHKLPTIISPEDYQQVQSITSIAP
ncbi:hypothetical protein J2Z48_002610 [Croceifilum oryzae]|uniref:Uncharacterized protein n=1 Tax=Croceifilum oryzae TaxID=1553429 RepID=A0AAJ1WTH8_9BACL|nr:hypothetical protein [Croceifilum oryzae]MDQ0418418.1 hypothetical protein [Croceifilum oryzae]